MDSENFLQLALLWLLTAVAGFAGWRAGAGRGRGASVLAMVLAGLLLAGAALLWHPSRLPDWLISLYTLYCQSSWFALPAAALFLLGAQQLKVQAQMEGARAPTEQTKQSYRRSVYLLWLIAGFVVLVASIRLLAPPQFAAPAAMPADGVVRQTTGYTCGAASCATLLRRLEIDPGATEAEMARLCMTHRWGGTTTLGMAVGLKSKLAGLGWQVRILEPDWDTFVRLRKPCLAAIRHSALVSHSVVVCGIDPLLGVQVADPLLGLRRVREDSFKRLFQSETVVVFRNDPFESD
jgi:predicted double-glycine peptidase